LFFNVLACSVLSETDKWESGKKYYIGCLRCCLHDTVFNWKPFDNGVICTCKTQM